MVHQRWQRRYAPPQACTHVLVHDAPGAAGTAHKRSVLAHAMRTHALYAHMQCSHLCMMPLECRYDSADTISAAYSRACGSSKTPSRYKLKKRWPPLRKSSTRYSLEGV
eukprot:366252-Chlamydomonas_euryale.AAC.12